LGGLKNRPTFLKGYSMFSLILMVAGLVLFILAGLGIPNPPRFNLMAFGLACWIGAEIAAHKFQN
jgi:hypothetical protein